MSTAYTQLKFILGAYDVDRFHSTTILEKETVAAHSYLVAVLCWLMLGEECSAALLVSALAHDLAESELGDIPAPSKRAIKETVDLQQIEEDIHRRNHLLLPNLEQKEDWVLKASDICAGLLKTNRERQMGNKHPSLLNAHKNYTQYLKEHYRNAPFNTTATRVEDIINTVLGMTQ